MNSEEFLERFNEGKISYKLPSKYPENFALCKSYHDGKREIPLAHKEKVEKILKDSYIAIKPVLKKFKLSLALLIESEVTYKGVAWTKKIKVNFSNPTEKEKKEELIAYTNMIQIKIRNKDHPQNPKMFLNKTTVLAIMLHELAHLRHMNHSIDFALFLQEIYLYAMTLELFNENEEHMIPSSRAWERRMFETKGKIKRDELDEFFKNIDANEEDDSLDHEHGEAEEKGKTKEEKEKKKILENKSAIVSKVSESKVKIPLKSNSLKINKAEVKKEQVHKHTTSIKVKTHAFSNANTVTNTKPIFVANLKDLKIKKPEEKTKKTKENDKVKVLEVITLKKIDKSGNIIYSEEVIDAEAEFEKQMKLESNINNEIIQGLRQVTVVGNDKEIY